MTTDNLLTPTQTAALLGTTTQTLAKWRRDGAVHLPFLTYEGQIVYRSSDIQQYLDAQDDDEEDDDDDADDDDPTGDDE